mmetsp:Transcript_83057/g.192946  ORF Transcript_83057/g.192946 Transcript_83057/m.192946 type:complete len:315 (+) Transcript_83057:68-1012(+)|eukprot:CAMPEP_0171059218 /NCGR_PEP_ID=MMETSP0766_2-20121228/3059_1 /TAXON_ID=439317 /ORGANISM="Gambierdiscus australes, Strain CAWD 149" /LENGTH=314 /DNA_ID=CAMNT_0011514641 /DNA_START=57 /DNA_END=1001 /DNA_ORIENTATION=-
MAEETLDEEELQLEYEEVCNEVAELTSELRATAIETQQMRMRLQAIMRNNKGKDARLGPASLPGSESIVLEDQRMEEMRNLLRWLADHVDLDRQEVLDVGFEVPIGGRTVQLLRIVQWPLASAFGGQLWLSAPVEHHEGLADLLTKAKAQGLVAPQALRAFVLEWDLVAGELLAATHVHAEPSVLLAHRGSARGILVARWPTREALEAFHALHTAGVEMPRVGDRVEVEYEGRWYAGVLHSVDAAGKAGVKCDVDAPGVITVTPLHRLRRVANNPPSVAEALVACSADAGGGFAGVHFAQKPAAGHRRTRSSAL